jgi:hypothetical protein
MQSMKARKVIAIASIVNIALRPPIAPYGSLRYGNPRGAGATTIRANTTSDKLNGVSVAMAGG